MALACALLPGTVLAEEAHPHPELVRTYYDYGVAEYCGLVDAPEAPVDAAIQPALGADPEFATLRLCERPDARLHEPAEPPPGTYDRQHRRSGRARLRMLAWRSGAVTCSWPTTSAKLAGRYFR